MFLKLLNTSRCVWLAFGMRPDPTHSCWWSVNVAVRNATCLYQVPHPLQRSVFCFSFEIHKSTFTNACFEFGLCCSILRGLRKHLQRFENLTAYYARFYVWVRSWLHSQHAIVISTAAMVHAAWMHGVLCKTPFPTFTTKVSCPFPGCSILSYRSALDDVAPWPVLEAPAPSSPTQAHTPDKSMHLVEVGRWITRGHDCLMPFLTRKKLPQLKRCSSTLSFFTRLLYVKIWVLLRQEVSGQLEMSAALLKVVTCVFVQSSSRFEHQLLHVFAFIHGVLLPDSTSCVRASSTADALSALQQDYIDCGWHPLSECECSCHWSLLLWFVHVQIVFMRFGDNCVCVCLVSCSVPFVELCVLSCMMNRKRRKRRAYHYVCLFVNGYVYQCVCMYVWCLK